MVTYGMTHTLVQTKLNTLAIEKRDRRKSLYRFVDNVLADSQSCLNTLQGQPLSLPSTAPERSFEITALKDATGGTLMDFKKTNGILDDAATKEKLKNLGIDKFESLKFRYKTALPRTGQVVLTSKTVVKGLHEKSNREIIWEISGLKVETKTDSDNNTSQQVTLCQDSVPLKILCGDNVTGTGHLNGGGFVQNTATVDQGAFVSDKAVVCGTAKVKGTAKVLGNAQVKGNAEIKERALVYDNAKVSGNAVISGDARVFDSAKVDGAKIYGKAKVYGMAKVEGNGIEIYGDAQVFDNAQVKDNAEIYGNAKILGAAVVKNGAKIYGNAKANDNVEIGGTAEISGSATITDDSRVVGSAIVKGTAVVKHNATVASNAILQDSAIIEGTSWAFENAWIKDKGVVSGGAWVSGGTPNDRPTVGGDVWTNKSVNGNCKCVMNKDTRYGCRNVILTRSCGRLGRETEICGKKNAPYLPLKHKKSPNGSLINIRNNANRPYTAVRNPNNNTEWLRGGPGYFRNGCTSTPTQD